MDPLAGPQQSIDVSGVPMQPQMPVQESAPSDAQVQGQDPQQLDPQQRNVAPHPLSMATRVFHALAGNTTNYVQTPDGPQAVQTPNKPGDLFRHILAGAMMGAAAGGEEGPHTFWSGASRGMGAAQQGAQQADDRRRQQAQLEFQNKIAAAKEQREANAAQTEDQLRKAQMAATNAETARTNFLLSSASYDMHQKIADADNARTQTYKDAGVKPVFEDVPETQMQDLIKNSPGAGSLDWRHTGVKTVQNPDGSVNYVSTMSAYDPKSNMPLSKATLDQWKKDGLLDYNPQYKDILQPGKDISVQQFMALDHQAQTYGNQRLARQKNDLELQHFQAQIDEAHAAMKHSQAETGLVGLSIQEKKEEMAQRKYLDTAFNHLSAAGNDPDKLTDPHDRIVLAKYAQPAMTEALAGIKEATAASQNGDQDAKDKLPEMWANYSTLTKLASLGGPKTATTTALTPAGSNVQKTVQFVQNMDPDQAQETIQNSTILSDAEKQQALQQWKTTRQQNNQATRGATGSALLNVLPRL